CPQMETAALLFRQKCKSISYRIEPLPIEQCFFRISSAIGHLEHCRQICLGSEIADKLCASSPVNGQIMCDPKNPRSQAIVRDSSAARPVDIKPQKRFL